MRFYRILAAGCCALLAATGPQGARGAETASPANNTYTYLGTRLAERIDAMEWGGGRLRMLVEDADLPIRAYAREANVGFAPGTLMQIVSGGALLDRLGPGYRFTTELQMFGVVQDKTLKGGIVARGTGDAALSSQYLGRGDLFDPLNAWAKLVRAQGIKKVDGGVIGDDSYFDEQILATGCPMTELGDARLPSVGALNFNHNLIEIDWKGTRRADVAAPYSVFPNLPDYIFFSSHVAQRTQMRVPLKYTRMRDGNTIAASGDIQVRVKRRDFAAIQNPAVYFAAALRHALIENGVEVTGGALALNGGSPGVISGEPRILDTHLSPPLEEMLAWAARKNSSLEFDTAFKHMGRRFAGTDKPATFEMGGRATQAFLTHLLAPQGSAVILDGSGRSELNRLTCEQILWVIRKMRGHAAKDVYAGMFPQAGDAETVLAERFGSANGDADTPDDAESARRPFEGKAPVWGLVSHGKDHQGAAGWTNSQAGRALAFVIAVEGSTLPEEQVRRQIDALVLEVASGGSVR